MSNSRRTDLWCLDLNRFNRCPEPKGWWLVWVLVERPKIFVRSYVDALNFGLGFNPLLVIKDQFSGARIAIANLDETGFKTEVAKHATAQPQLRDAFAGIAAEEFGEAGRQTVLQIWEKMLRASFSKVAGRFDALRPKIEEAKAKLAEPSRRRHRYLHAIRGIFDQALP